MFYSLPSLYAAYRSDPRDEYEFGHQHNEHCQTEQKNKTMAATVMGAVFWLRHQPLKIISMKVGVDSFHDIALQIPKEMEAT